MLNPPDSASFIETVNPNARPRVTTQHRFDPRELLFTQPVLAKNEPLPGFLKLEKGELALSSQPKPGYFYLKNIGWYAPTRHHALANLIEQELEDSKIPHGTSKGYNKGCTGPLCRRANRQYRKRTKTKAVYYSTDPLLAVMTAYAYQQQKLTPKTQIEKKLAKLLEKEAAREEYPELVA